MIGCRGDALALSRDQFKYGLDAVVEDIRDGSGPQLTVHPQRVNLERTRLPEQLLDRQPFAADRVEQGRVPRDTSVETVGSKLLDLSKDFRGDVLADAALPGAPDELHLALL